MGESSFSMRELQDELMEAETKSPDYDRYLELEKVLSNIAEGSGPVSKLSGDLLEIIMTKSLPFNEVLDKLKNLAVEKGLVPSTSTQTDLINKLIHTIKTPRGEGISREFLKSMADVVRGTGWEVNEQYLTRGMGLPTSTEYDYMHQRSLQREDYKNIRTVRSYVLELKDFHNWLRRDREYKASKMY